MSKKLGEVAKILDISRLAFMAVFVLIFVEQYLDIITIPSIVYTAISCCVFLLMKPFFATQYFIMLVPFSNAVHIKEIAVFYLVVIIMKMMFKNKLFKISVGTLLSFSTVIILQSIATIRSEDELSTLVYLFFIMGCVIFWSRDFRTEEASKKLLKSYVLSFTMMALFMIVLTFKLAPLQQILGGFVRLGEDAYFSDSAFHTGANGLGMMCLFNAAIICYLLMCKSIGKVRAIVLLSLFVLTGSMTQSRAFIVGCVFFIVYLVIFFTNSPIRAAKLMALSAMIIFTTGVIINHYYPNILLSFVSRFEVDDITNGRTELWSGYFESLFSDPISMLIGAGLRTYPYVLGNNLGNAYSHNATQEVFLAWGIIGFVAVVIWFISLFVSRGVKTHTKTTIMQALFPLFMMLFMVQSTRIFGTYTSIFLIGIALFCIVPNKEK